MTWTKVEPWKEPVYQGCLNCPPVTRLAQLDILIAVGFGIATATCDDKVVFMESSIVRYHQYSPELALLLVKLMALGQPRWGGLPILADIEELARKDPDHDWRVALWAPLRGREYQRHGPGQWVLIHSDKGFA